MVEGDGASIVGDESAASGGTRVRCPGLTVKDGDAPVGRAEPDLAMVVEGNVGDLIAAQARQRSAIGPPRFPVEHGHALRPAQGVACAKVDRGSIGEDSPYVVREQSRIADVQAVPGSLIEDGYTLTSPALPGHSEPDPTSRINSHIVHVVAPQRWRRALRVANASPIGVETGDASSPGSDPHLTVPAVRDSRDVVGAQTGVGLRFCRPFLAVEDGHTATDVGRRRIGVNETFGANPDAAGVVEGHVTDVVGGQDAVPPVIERPLARQRVQYGHTCTIGACPYPALGVKYQAGHVIRGQVRVIGIVDLDHGPGQIKDGHTPCRPDPLVPIGRYGHGPNVVAGQARLWGEKLLITAGLSVPADQPPLLRPDPEVVALNGHSQDRIAVGVGRPDALLGGGRECMNRRGP